MLVQSKMQLSAWLDKTFARCDLHYWKWIKQTMPSELCANHATKTQKWIYWNVIYSVENELSGQCNQQLPHWPREQNTEMNVLKRGDGDKYTSLGILLYTKKIFLSMDLHELYWVSYTPNYHTNVSWIF